MSGELRILAGAPVYVCAPEGPKLDGERAAIDLIGDMYGTGAGVAAIPIARLDERFLDLSTQVAGEVVQKFVNYGVRLAFVGDVSAAVARSHALRDYVRECNRGRHVWFVADLAALESRLAGLTSGAPARSFGGPLPEIAMQTRKLGPFDVSAIGLGCMSLSHAYGTPPPRETAEQVLLGALDAGYTFFDTAVVYGLGHNETLVGEVLSPHRDRFVLASKCGITDATGTQRGIDGRPETIKALCDVSLRGLKTDVIDLYYLHRWDQRVPIEDSVGALADLVAAGKIRSIGLSEVSAPTLRRAHATHPIAALQTEYSPWTRNPEIAVLDACHELGVTFVAFSPVGRGFLAGGVRDVAALEENDFRRGMPRFQGDAFAKNLALFDRFAALAAEAGCTPAQLCLAWLLQKDPTIVPIPGTANPAHMRENAAAAGVALSPEVMAKVDALVNGDTVTGPRYAPAMQASVDTERMPSEMEAA